MKNEYGRHTPAQVDGAVMERGENLGGKGMHGGKSQI